MRAGTALTTMILLGHLIACGALRERPERGSSPSAPGARLGSVPVAAPRDDCGERFARVVATGTPVRAARSGEQRAQLLARAKASPVIFLREPAPSLTANGTGLREALDQATEPAKVLASVARVLKRDRALARAVLLREGYLYFTQPALASAIVRGFTLEDLFDAAEIVVERGAEVRRAERVRWGYAWADGPDKGQHAELMLFDRVREATEPSAEPLHRDLTALRRELGFTQAEVVARAGDEVALRLAYDAASSEAVVSVAQGVVTLSCEALPTMGREQILEQRREQTLRAGALGAVWATVQQLVREGLPFDEPKTEEGQQDGKLRQEWATAYARGEASYEFNGDRYAVFDGYGRPYPPQVCIDFVLDAFERTSGTWWRARNERRERTVGHLSLTSLGLGNRRSVRSFIDFAWGHPAWFDVYVVPEEERVPLTDRRVFFASLYANRALYWPGDIVAIEGFRSDGKRHYHSFIVVQSDPLTGMPTLVAANAGRPRVRSWESEMLSAPRRSVLARIRPRTDWLRAVVLGEGALPVNPSWPEPLSPGELEGAVPSSDVAR